MEKKLAITASSYFAAVPLFGAISPVVPEGLNPGDTFYYIGLSTTADSGADTSRSYYDNLVNTDAANNGLTTISGQSVTWKALISMFEGTTALSVFDPDSPVYLLNGTRVADDGADLWDGTIQAAIDYALDGTTVASTSVWTGTASDGTEYYIDDMGKGIGQDAFMWTGLSDSTSATWVDEDRADGDELPFYAFSSAVVVVPEPEQIATGVFAGLVAVVGAWFRRRKGRS